MKRRAPCSSPLSSSRPVVLAGARRTCRCASGKPPPERHVRDQARDMATMAVEKIEMAVLKTEEEGLARLQLAVRDRARLARARSTHGDRDTPFFERDRPLRSPQGGSVIPSGPRRTSRTTFELRREIPPGFWDRGGRRHVPLGDGVALAAVIPDPPGDPLLAVLERSEQGLAPRHPREDPGEPRRAERPRRPRPVRSPGLRIRGRSIMPSTMLTVAFGETLPSWRARPLRARGRCRRSDVVRRQISALHRGVRAPPRHDRPGSLRDLSPRPP